MALYLAIRKGEELNWEMVCFGVKRGNKCPDRVLKDANSGPEAAGSLLGETVDGGDEHHQMNGGDNHEIQVLEPRPVLIAPRLQFHTNQFAIHSLINT